MRFFLGPWQISVPENYKRIATLQSEEKKKLTFISWVLQFCFWKRQLMLHVTVLFLVFEAVILVALQYETNTESANDCISTSF